MRDVSRTQLIPHDYDVLIIGGGAAGITVAAELLKHRSTLSVTIVEPSESHAYKPADARRCGGVLKRADYPV